MVRKIIAYILIIAVIAVNYGRFFAYAGYELNKNYIASKLCENRNKQWMHCNGRCYLMKKLKQAEDKQNSAEKEAQKNSFQEGCFNLNASLKFNSLLLQVISTPYQEVSTQNWTTVIIEPPRLS